MSTPDRDMSRNVGSRNVGENMNEEKTEYIEYTSLWDNLAELDSIDAMLEKINNHLKSDHLKSENPRQESGLRLETTSEALNKEKGRYSELEENCLGIEKSKEFEENQEMIEFEFEQMKNDFKSIKTAFGAEKKDIDLYTLAYISSQVETIGSILSDIEERITDQIVFMKQELASLASVVKELKTEINLIKSLYTKHLTPELITDLSSRMFIAEKSISELRNKISDKPVVLE